MPYLSNPGHLLTCLAMFKHFNNCVKSADIKQFQFLFQRVATWAILDTKWTPLSGLSLIVKWLYYPCPNRTSLATLSGSPQIVNPLNLAPNWFAVMSLTQLESKCRCRQIAAITILAKKKINYLNMCISCILYVDIYETIGFIYSIFFCWNSCDI